VSVDATSDICLLRQLFRCLFYFRKARLLTNFSPERRLSSISGHPAAGPPGRLFFLYPSLLAGRLIHKGTQNANERASAITHVENLGTAELAERSCFPTAQLRALQPDEKDRISRSR
jgi:hypothetical protein